MPRLLLAADPDVLRGDVAGHGAGRVDASWESVHLSWKPRAQLLRGFLLESECDALVAAANAAANAANATPTSRVTRIKRVPMTFNLERIFPK